MIVKIQRPLSSNVPADQDMAMVYNRNKSYVTYLLMSDVQDLFEDGSLRVYHMAKRRTSPPGTKTIPQSGVGVGIGTGDDFDIESADEYLKIGKRVADQAW